MGQSSSQTYMIYGHVADLVTRAPLYNTWVYLMDKDYRILDSVQAVRKGMNGKDGGYMFQKRYPKDSEYVLRFSHPGYPVVTIPIKLKHKHPLSTAYIKKVHDVAGNESSETDAIEYAWGLGDEGKTKIEILKESPAYVRDPARNERFEYALPSDSLLAMTRERFNLDSIAGNGDDISRIKNLLYWVHDNIEHDGNNGFPKGSVSLTNMYYSAKRDSCGYNCRALAIALTEALLAEGIPARYITCESKEWDTDGDCHVICVAWSESLDKWVWVDPSFAAFVTDENGLMLHPGEVRFRLQHDMPLILNEDANWNHREKQTKEDYLEDYMAKNLYIFSSNMFNQAEPEGPSNHRLRQGIYAALVPQGSNYSNAGLITTDEEWFWQAPKK